MATEEYKWFFDLVEFTMTKDVANDYTAAVKRLRSLTIEDVAKAICAERTEYRPETLVNTCKLVDEMICRLVCQGNTVVTGSAQYSPDLNGLFIGETGEVKPENKCIVNVSPSLALRREVAKVKPVFSGNVKNLGGARIGLVKDVTTGLTDGTITPGGMLDVPGAKLRCLNVDGTGVGQLTLVSTADESVAATITVLAVNDPSRLVFSVPASLPVGSYRLKLETYYSNTSTLLKEARVLTSPLDLVVANADDSGGGDDDRPVIE